jgi:translation elongation factor EF-G
LFFSSHITPLQTKSNTLNSLKPFSSPESSGPVFINKVDRLKKELKLSPSEIQKRFVRIITDFNNIIETCGESDFGEKRKVDLPNKVLSSVQGELSARVLCRKRYVVASPLQIYA